MARHFSICALPRCLAPLRYSHPSRLFHFTATSSSLLHCSLHSQSQTQSRTPQHKRTPNFAFAFDIDGVLLRSSRPIPGASSTLSYLQRHAIPFILLTNGGGRPESARLQSLNKSLSLPSPLQFPQLIQSHTPLSELAIKGGHPSYKDKCVLVLGGDGDNARLAAEGYGFTNVITSGDIYNAYPEVMPFSRNFAQYHQSYARPLPAAMSQGELKVDCIMVFNDPRDWALDVQLVLDLLLSKEGRVGTYSSRNGKMEYSKKILRQDGSQVESMGYQSDGQPKLYFSNADLLWASAYPLSRLGQGGFMAALEGVWAQITRQGCGVSVPLQKTVLGKPHRLTYEFAEKVLVKQREEMHGRDIQEKTRLEAVYMVGDNPESDIKGANWFNSGLYPAEADGQAGSGDAKGSASLIGAEWISILTRTGVYKESHGRPSEEPRVIVDDVKTAVEWALKKSEWSGDGID